MEPAAQRKEKTIVSPSSSRNRILISLILGFVSLLVYLWGIGSPSKPFYDEGQYVFSAQALLRNLPNPNPEAPPLGKLLIAGGIKVLGDNPYGWRVPSAICGALTIVAVFLWADLLLNDLALGLMAAALAFLSNFTFVLSRVAMMDASLVALVMWSLVAFTAALRLDLSAFQRRILMCCAGILAGLAAACKWNAVDALAGMLLVSFVLPWLASRMKPEVRESISHYAENLKVIGIPSLLVALLVLPAISYSLTYWPLCRSLHVQFGIHQIVEMNRFIWRFHRAIVSNPAITSPWYSWPLKSTPQRGLSYLLGNPFVLWSGLLALGYCAWKLRKSLEMPEALLVLLYATNMLQWAVTPQNGILYYYYYPAAMILCVALAAALRDVPERVWGVRVRLVLLLAAATFFLWCLPRMANLGAPWDCALGCWS